MKSEDTKTRPEIAEFDLLKSPLAGTNLIEASAGTGKTYTIVALYLRLILERNLSANQILVVTFTEAATGELRDRVRNRIREAIEVFSGQKDDDAFLSSLAAEHPDPLLGCRQLQTALRDFDQAAIFTIHGFCHRVLHESAFESGSYFDTELVADQQQLKRQVVADFWRNNFYQTSPLFFNFAVAKHLTPGELLSLLGNRAEQPFIKIIPPAEIPDTADLEEEFQTCFAELAEAWAKARDEVGDLLSNCEGLKRSQYKVDNIPRWLAAMESYLSSNGNDPQPFKEFEKFTTSKIRGATKKGHAPLDHDFFDRCEDFIKVQKQLVDAFERRLLGLKAALFDFAGKELAKRKQEANVLSFDDLLLNLHSALMQDGGSELAGYIRAKFPAALIDEFQDTDPVQYAIFKKIFDHEDSALFLIGDPKQAIYAFRGADIFAYMEAARNLDHLFTLGKNWRSDPRLIAGVNAVFSRANRPFVYDEIPFHSVAPGKLSDHETLQTAEELKPPLQLWFLPADSFENPDKPIRKPEAQASIANAVASEISRLLILSKSGQAAVAGKFLEAGQVAVLVRKNSEAGLLQKALTALGIPSVLYSTENVFDSFEAMEMERLLAGLVEPDNERLLKAALATEMMGIQGEQLEQLQIGDEGEWEKWLIAFKRYHDFWAAGGFIRMFRRLATEQSLLERLMALPRGDRRITDLLHLAEVLHQASTENKLNMAGLLKWFSEQRDPESLRLEEHQLRLESDENAVKLVTMHKSKGLEYPVVFCPFTWSGSKIRNSTGPLLFHDEADGMTLTLDLGSPEADSNRQLAEKELLAENVRLLYVALTRAKSRCYLVWGRFSQAETSAPAYILHPPALDAGSNPVAATAEKFSGMTEAGLMAELKELEAAAQDAIELSLVPERPGETYASIIVDSGRLSCLKFAGTIDREWRISSFSSLVSDQPHRADLADHDELIVPEGFSDSVVEELRSEEKPLNIFTFPRGAAAGTLLHEIFEELDFTASEDSSVEELIAGKLREHGFDQKWLDVIRKMARDVLSTPLDPNLPQLELRCIEQQDRLNELEFYFPLNRISNKELGEIFSSYPEASRAGGFPGMIGRLNFAPAKGFLKGFIDLVFRFDGRFYLVDWKSNFLGDRIENYDEPSLHAAMINEMYVLQYHIYSLALHRYLKVRVAGYDYDSHFGGVYYIFLRGVVPERGPAYGIFRDRPPLELMERLSERLIEPDK